MMEIKSRDISVGGATASTMDYIFGEYIYNLHVCFNIDKKEKELVTLLTP